MSTYFKSLFVLGCLETVLPKQIFGFFGHADQQLIIIIIIIIIYFTDSNSLSSVKMGIHWDEDGIVQMNTSCNNDYFQRDKCVLITCCDGTVSLRQSTKNVL